jgi:hypothetical protein
MSPQSLSFTNFLTTSRGHGAETTQAHAKIHAKSSTPVRPWAFYVAVPLYAAINVVIVAIALGGLDALPTSTRDSITNTIVAIGATEALSQ